MALATIVSPSGGVLQGDRLEIDVRVGGGARLHLDTPSATRLYRMPDGRAEQRVSLGRRGRWLPGVPARILTIPFAGADFASRTRAEVAEAATLILAEVVTRGPGCPR